MTTPIRGRAIVGQQRHLAEGVGAAHLQHRHLGASGHLEQGERQADLGVDVAGAAVGPASLAQDGGDDLLGAGLADAAGDADDGADPVSRARQRAARRCKRQRPARRRRGAAEPASGWRRPRSALTRAAVAPAAAASLDEVVAVEALAPDGDEEIAGLACRGVVRSIRSKASPAAGRRAARRRYPREASQAIAGSSESTLRANANSRRSGESGDWRRPGGARQRATWPSGPAGSSRLRRIRA